MINIKNICPPALIFIIFSLVQMIFDVLQGAYNTAFFKGVVLIMVGILLNLLCQRGLSVVSWIIVFIPFIFISVIVAVLLYAFGLDPNTGMLNTTPDTDENKDDDNNTVIIRQGNIVHTNKS